MNYQLHLLQVQFADRLLGLTLDRLRKVGLYDRSLIVVVADHGAAFRANRPYKLAVPSTLAEIGLIPFFLKEPGVRRGAVVDAPLEAIDVLPTIAHVLDVSLPWKTDGRPVQEDQPARERRELCRHGSRERRMYSADDFERGLEAAEHRKREAIEPDPARLGWRGDPARELIGRPIAALHVTGDSMVAVHIDDAGAFDSIDPRGPYVPVYVSGTVRSLSGSTDARASLAIAVNGVIRATTSIARRPVAGRRGF